MADSKKYYYLKLKDNFFESEEILILEAMQDGVLYSNILLKLYLRSLKNNGRLLFKDLIPYTPDMLSTIVRQPVAVVEKALHLFQQLQLIEILDTGAIYMRDIENFIGKSSTEAEKKKEYRARIAGKMDKVGQMSGQCPPEIEKDIELDIDIKTDRKIEKEKDQLSTDQDQVKKCLKYYESVTGIMPLPLIQTEIQDYLGQKIQSDLICTAIQEAVNKNITQWSYIKAILERCLQDGIYTAEDFTTQKYKTEPVSKDRMQRKTPLPTFTVQE